jgi:diadenosine tetraphosphate (Ap4A) HIT family hydrolase
METEQYKKIGTEIKEYGYWKLLLHKNQEYPGRCVLWCKREDAIDPADMSEAEKNELFAILKQVRDAYRKSFLPELVNYNSLGNKVQHLHIGIIPRYKSPVEFEGVVFEDKYFGKEFQTDPNFNIPEGVAEKIKLRIEKSL